MRRAAAACLCVEVTRLSSPWLSWLWLSWLWLSWHSSPISANGFFSDPRIVEHPQSAFVLRNGAVTLRCRAEGLPLPVITWYHNGEPVRSSSSSRNRKLVLANGDLVIARFLQKMDSGSYQCTATDTHTRRSAVSETAILDVASMGDEFQVLPKSSMSLIGGRVELECRPPHGRPEPKVKWKKDGVVVNATSSSSSSSSWNLILEQLRKDDVGNYSCVAYSAVGEKDSGAVTVSIAEKPKVFAVAKELIAGVNSTLFIQCSATGVPSPTITWTKTSSSSSFSSSSSSSSSSSGDPVHHRSGRLGTMDDGRLRIEGVQVVDGGEYTCTAENDFGWHSDSVHLAVHAPPSFLLRPVDRVVAVGRRVAFLCKVTGIPRPAVFWNREPIQMLMFPSEDHGRFSVSDEGTLFVDSVRREDSGLYVCKALSPSGIAVARATLDVRDALVYPPPLMLFGPENQTLVSPHSALMPCSASGDPQPTIKWVKDGREVKDDQRLSLMRSGSLFISELRSSDAGSYTCTAVNDFGQSSRSATLDVVVLGSFSDLPVTLKRASDPNDLPGPPSTPVPVAVTDSSVELTWQRGNGTDPGATGASTPPTGFLVEYFGQDATESWTFADDEAQNETYCVRGLQSDTYYVFVVRASSDLGVGLPSPVSQPIKTKGLRLKPLDGATFNERNSGHVIGLFQPEVISSTAIKITWELRRPFPPINGVHVKYRPTYEQVTSSKRHHLPEFATVAIGDSDVTSYTLTDLTECTWYEIRVLPNYVQFKGQHGGGTIKVRTPAGAPVLPPVNIAVTSINETSVVLRWEPPSVTSSCHEPIVGFKIYIRTTDDHLNEEIRVNWTVNVVYVHHLLKNATYELRMSTFGGSGEESAATNPVSIGHRPRSGLFCISSLSASNAPD